MRPEREHAECWDLIPWIVNGSASSAEQQAVQAHLGACRECRDELARQRELHSHVHAADSVITAPQASWQKLIARIEADAARASPIGQPRRAQRRWLAAAVWIQGAAIALLLVYSLGTWRPAAEYVTLSADISAPAAGAGVRVVFAPDTSVGQMNEILHALQFEVVAGPSEAGVFTLRRAGSKSPDVREALATLRRHEAVLFAEPTESAR